MGPDLAENALGRSPIADLASSLVFFGQAADVRTVIAKGEVLLCDRRPVRVDADAVVAEAREEAAKALERLDLATYRRKTVWDGVSDWR